MYVHTYVHVLVCVDREGKNEEEEGGKEGG